MLVALLRQLIAGRPEPAQLGSRAWEGVATAAAAGSSTRCWVRVCQCCLSRCRLRCCCLCSCFLCCCRHILWHASSGRHKQRVLPQTRARQPTARAAAAEGGIQALRATGALNPSDFVYLLLQRMRRASQTTPERLAGILPRAPALPPGSTRTLRVASLCVARWHPRLEASPREPGQAAGPQP